MVMLAKQLIILGTRYYHFFKIRKFNILVFTYSDSIQFTFVDFFYIKSEQFSSKHKIK
jgi:hypothetical protein